MDNRIFNDNKISRLLLRFAIPSIVSLLVLEFYNMVDTIYVGRYVGANAIGGLTIAFPVQRLISSIAMMISIGASTYAARSLGEKDYTSLKKSIANAFMLTILLLTSITIFMYIFKSNVIDFLGASENIHPYANSYISIILLGGIFQCLSIVASYIITALGNPKVALYSNIIGALVNIVLDYIFVAIFGLGVEGAAIATVISQIIAFIYVFNKFYRTMKSLNISFSIGDFKIAFSLEFIWGITAVGFSTFIIEISDAVVTLILNNLLSNLGGDAAIVIIGVVTRISMFMFIAIIGISSAMQPIVAYNYGARDYGKIKEALKEAIKTVVTVSVSFWLILMVFAKPIIEFFLKDEAILSDAVVAFRTCIMIIPVISVYYVAIYYYQAIDNAKSSFLLSIYRQLVVFIPLALLFVQWFGILGAWIAYPVSDLVAALTSVYYIRKAITKEFKEDVEKGELESVR